jgi:hypothetical protein
MFRIRKAILLFLVFSSLVWSAPPGDKYPDFGLFSRINKISGVQQKPNTLAKKAALQWRQTGTINYSNSTTAADSVWKFFSRDTIIYDIDGNEVIRKTSNAHSGWSKDSLRSFDSTVYQNGKMIEKTQEHYSNDGSISYGYKYSFTYLNNEKTVVQTNYDWNDSLSNWIPNGKDSVIFSAPLNNTIHWDMIDLHSLLKYYMYAYKDSSWKSAGYLFKVDSECNETTVALSGKQLSYDSLIDYKTINIYNSSIWSTDNLTEKKGQTKNPDGEFYDSYKIIYSANGYTDYDYEWDSTSKLPVCTHKNFDFTDSHKNDTLYLNCNFDTSSLSWDTSMIRYTRTYDANGNNIITVESNYNLGTWSFWSKDVNTFSQINVPVIHFAKAISRQNISILQTAGLIRFFAPDITGLKLYNIEGRLVTSVKQNAASFVTLNLAGPNTKISSGSYIAKLECKGAVNSIPVVITK